MRVLKLIGDEGGWNGGIRDVTLLPAKKGLLLGCIHRGAVRNMISYLSYDF